MLCEASFSTLVLSSLFPRNRVRLSIVSNHRSFSLLLPFQIILGGTEDIEDIHFDNDSVITDIMLVGVTNIVCV